MSRRMNDRVRLKSIALHQQRFLQSIWARYYCGFVFTAARNRKSRTWWERAQKIGCEAEGVGHFLKEYSPDEYDLYFCPSAFREPRRIAALAMRTPYAWCDIDDADPACFVPRPTILIETSPGRTQGLWEFEEKFPASKAEAVSKHLAYAYGGDRNGWSSTKYLRLPFSLNHKPQYNCPTVKLIRESHAILTSWPKPLYGGTTAKAPSERLNPFAHDPLEVSKRYRSAVGGDRFRLMTDRALISLDRSRCVFMIVASLCEAGATANEIASVVWHSPYFISKYGSSRTKLNEEVSRILFKLRGVR